jgi:phenylpropionate dioxygenase-like ring-hydroxylating dioxygenase large terminal subunit
MAWEKINRYLKYTGGKMYPFKEGYVAVRNGWYVLAFAQDLKQELVSRWLLNEPVVLYRKANGEPVALSGLCPHRFYPLGKSQLSNDSITCGYHGFTFDAQGACTNIPGQDNIPSTCKLRRYAVVEHGMWIWVWAGEAEQADKSLLPDLVEISHDHPGFTPMPFYLHEIKARYQLLNDNLLDLSHLAFLHASSIGVMANATQPEELTEDGPRIIRSRRRMNNCPSPPVVKATVGYDGVIDQVNGMDFYAPGLHAGFADMFYPAGHPQAGQLLRKAQVFHAVTPATGNTCYYFFSMASDDVVQMEIMKEYLKKPVAEDIDASEAIEHMLSIHGEPTREVVKFSDRNTIRGRLLLQKLMEAERGNEKESEKESARTIE